MQNLLGIRRKFFLKSSHDATPFLLHSLYNLHEHTVSKGDIMGEKPKEPIDNEWLSLMLTAKNMNLTKEEIRAFIRQNANKSETKKDIKKE